MIYEHNLLSMKPSHQISDYSETSHFLNSAHQPTNFFVQELSASIEEAAQIDEGGTLNAIGRALLQMQQGSQTHSSPITTTSNQQMFLTSTEADNRTQLGTGTYIRIQLGTVHSLQC